MFPILRAGSPEVIDTRLPAFVVAHDGLYLRKQSLLGLSQTKVDGVDHLPAEKEFVEYALPKVPADLMARVVGFFRSIYRRQATEALVLLLWAGEGFDLFVPDQQVSPASVKHRLDESALPDDLRVIGSIHSHGAFGAGASSIDADDEAEFDGLHVVVGDFDRSRPSYSAAIAVDGHRFAIRTNVVLERPRRLIEPPEDWLRQVKLLPPPRWSKGRASPPGRTAPRRRSRPPSEPERATSISTSRSSGQPASPTSSDYHLSYWLVPVSGSSRKGGGADD